MLYTVRNLSRARGVIVTQPKILDPRRVEGKHSRVTGYSWIVPQAGGAGIVNPVQYRLAGSLGELTGGSNCFAVSGGWGNV